MFYLHRTLHCSGPPFDLHQVNVETDLIIKSSGSNEHLLNNTAVFPLSRLKLLRYKVAQCVLSWSIFLVALCMKGSIRDDSDIELLWFLPILCIFLFCCFSVLYSLKRPSPGERERKEKTSGEKMKKKAFNIILVHVLVYLANYLPTSILHYNFRHVRHSNLISDICVSLGIACGLVHPLFYLHRAGKFSGLKRAVTLKLKGQK